ncbi:MAG: leucyl aminopeptidase [Gammaproteobacteria bacterium]|jgi:leucyl aminopeptidase
MEFTVKSSKADSLRTDCLILAVSQSGKLSVTGAAVDKACDGQISAIIKKGDMKATLGQILTLHNPANINVQRIVLVGSGNESDMNDRNFIKMIQATAASFSNCGAKDANCYLNEVDVGNRDNSWKSRQTALAFANSTYVFDQTKSKRSSDKPKLRKLTIQAAVTGDIKNATKAAAEGKAISAGMDIARDLGNLPANICTPSYLAKQAISMSKGQARLKTTVLDETAMQKLKMGSLLSVSAGSRQPAKLIVIEYSGGKAKDKPIVLVGKGVTFDTGGISLKAGAAMDEMKFDMCGAASVFGTVNAVNQMKLPINVVGIIPATENMPDGLATKPGDVVTSMSGQTIEILNTDAEGRLILCDALTYAEKFKPSCVIDIATLTGACIVALGKVPSGVLGNHQPLIDELIASGQKIEDKIWQLPLWDEYQDQIKSNFADMANIGGRDAGTITAACFLSRFTKKYQWAHLDVAGTAWHSGERKGSTGRPVPLLSQFILDRCGQ